MNNIFKFLVVLILSTQVSSQTIQQVKAVDNQYWRITKAVSESEISRTLFGQAGSTIQVTYEDISLQKSILLKFATDKHWHRIVYGDYDKWLASFGSYGTGSQNFFYPTALDFGSYSVNGIQRFELFVLDRKNNRIQVLKINFRFSGLGGSGDTDIEFAASIPINKVDDIAFEYIDTKPYLITCSSSNNCLTFYDLSTGNYTLKNSYGSSGSGVGQFSFPRNVDAVKYSWVANQSILVNDAGNSRVAKLIPQRNVDGTISLSWSNSMTYNFIVNSITADAYGNIFLTDATNNRILKYDNNFVFLKSFGSYGTGQSPNLINNPMNFTTGIYVSRPNPLSLSFPINKNDVSFLTESWGDQSGGIVYDLGTELTALSVSGPGNLVNTQISYFVTDMSYIYATIERQSGSSWTFVRSYGYPIGSASQYVAYPGANYFIWDGKDANGVLQPNSATFRVKVYAKEVYSDPDAVTQTREVQYKSALDVSIIGPTYVSSSGCTSRTYSASVSGGNGNYKAWWGSNSIFGMSVSYYLCPPTTNVYVHVEEVNGTKQGNASVIVTVQGSGGCPYVFAETENGLMIDNNILHRSEFKQNKNKNIEDLYKLNMIPAKTEQGYKLQIKELNSDHSYFDKFNLYTVDHAPGTEVGITEENRIIKYNSDELISADEISFENGESIQGGLDEIEGAKGEVMHLKFSQEKTNQLRSASAKSGELNELALLVDFRSSVVPMLPPKEPVATISSKSTTLYKTKANKIEFARREQNSVVLIPLTNDMKLEDIEIAWNRNFSFRKIGLIPIIDVSEKSQELKLKSAIHSKYGDVIAKLNQVDKKYAELDSAETIDLVFEAVNDPNEKLMRSFVFETNGYYVVPGTTETIIPKDFGLEQNYPNPFNPTTTIRYNLKEDTKVILTIYNTLGQVVKTLVDADETAGVKNVIWDGTDNFGKQVASGIYFYKLKAGKSVFAKKMLFIK